MSTYRLGNILNFPSLNVIWDKVFKNGTSKIFGRQPLKNLKVIWSASADHINHINSNFLKAVFHKFQAITECRFTLNTYVT